MRIPLTDSDPDSPYTLQPVEGDAFVESGLSAVTGKGTFPYPEAVNLRRTPGLSGTQISMLPFGRLGSTVHAQVDRRAAIKTQYGD